MSKIQNSKQYDLEGRSARFAEQGRDFVRRLPATIHTIEYGTQLIRSSGSRTAGSEYY